MEISTEDKTRELRETFDLLDRNGDGLITLDEVEAALRTLGQEPSSADVATLLDGIEGPLSFDSFSALLTAYFDRGTAAANAPDVRDAELREAFRVFDKNNDGAITPDELAAVFLSLGEQLSEAEVAAMIASVDANKDGLISFDEFCHLMNHDCVAT